MAENMKSSRREKFEHSVESLKHGGRANIEMLHEIASTSVVELLDLGLTLEQAEMVLRMAMIEISRAVEEARMLPKSPAIEIKLKKGKKK